MKARSKQEQNNDTLKQKAVKKQELTLYPLDFKEATQYILQIKPEKDYKEVKPKTS